MAKKILLSNFDEHLLEKIDHAKDKLGVNRSEYIQMILLEKFDRNIAEKRELLLAINHRLDELSDFIERFNQSEIELLKAFKTMLDYEGDV